MTSDGGGAAGGNAVKAQKGGFLGSLKDALKAASRDDTQGAGASAASAVATSTAGLVPPVIPVAAIGDASPRADGQLPAMLSAEDAARLARTPVADPRAQPLPTSNADAPPTTRVVRRPVAPRDDRTTLVRGHQPIERGAFSQDPVVGFLVIVGGPGLGSFRPIFEGNNTVGRSPDNRIPLDFGDGAISAESQAYIRYDSTDRSFMFVPNLAKTNIVSVNEQRPAGAVPLNAMDVITLGRTQAAFVPFCGKEFDWSEISELKT